jgi:hypothetical protein
MSPMNEAIELIKNERGKAYNSIVKLLSAAIDEDTRKLVKSRDTNEMVRIQGGVQRLEYLLLRIEETNREESSK